MRHLILLTVIGVPLIGALIWTLHAHPGLVDQVLTLGR